MSSSIQTKPSNKQPHKNRVRFAKLVFAERGGGSHGRLWRVASCRAVVSPHLQIQSRVECLPTKETIRLMDCLCLFAWMTRVWTTAPRHIPRHGLSVTAETHTQDSYFNSFLLFFLLCFTNLLVTKVFLPRPESCPSFDSH